MDKRRKQPILRRFLLGLTTVSLFFAGVTATHAFTYVDDFDRSDNDDISTGAINFVYSEDTGDVDIVSNVAQTQGDISHIVSVTDPTTDCDSLDISVDVYTTDASGAGFYFCYTDSDNFYRVRINTFSQDVKLYVNDAGSSTELDSSSDGYSTGNVYTLRVLKSGDDITVYVSGVERLTSTNSVHDTGGVSLIADWGDVEFNNLTYVLDTQLSNDEVITIGYIDIATNSAVLTGIADYQKVQYVFWILLLITTGMTLGFQFLRK